MEKKDLKSGMVVETRNGKLGLILLGSPNGDVIAGNGFDKGSWMTLNAFNSDLTNSVLSECDIIKVYCGKYNKTLGTKDECIWERVESVEVTLKEIADMKGVDVSLIKIVE